MQTKSIYQQTTNKMSTTDSAVSHIVKECMDENSSANYELMKMTTQEWLRSSTSNLIWALENGADVNYEICMGATAIHRVKELRNVEILIEYGADVNWADSFGCVPLMFCNVEKAKLLLAAGAKINVQDDQGLTPLMHATFKQDPALVKLYLEAGADAHAVSKDGDTALDFAKGKNKKKIRGETQDKNQEIIEMLEAVPLPAVPLPAVPLPTAVPTLPLLEASSQLMDMIDNLANQIPEHIWIELILTNNMYEMYVPKTKRTELIQAVDAFTKHQQTKHDTHFRIVQSALNKDGLSEEHKSFRIPLNAYLNKTNPKTTRGIFKDMGRIDG